ncbi:ribosomal protein S7p/S5e [Oesophagostomum dentatum]|uniref:Ribosomal protein S7p/S5e n=1 Tax=Oesophagostomum dentatum TaxID=61180 RepID=A0A0B1TCN2_OESDE|nr:ribosomal protein S7p/S5e [Oesophagostomum dentatum]
MLFYCFILFLNESIGVLQVKLFGKWSLQDVNVSDITLVDYIAVKDKCAKYLPHSAGRYQVMRFRKAGCPIVERLCNSMMMHGRNNGKKLMTVRIVKHAFEIIHLLTGEVQSSASACKCSNQQRSS